MSTKSKKCYGCLAEKPLGEFYRHSKMADGRLNFCAMCFRERAKANRLKNLERYRAHDRDRAKLPHRRAACTENNRHSSKRAFRYAVSNAIRDGKLSPLPCFVCGEKAEAHHPSYAPGMELCVVWLCQYHHQQCHGRLD